MEVKHGNAWVASREDGSIAPGEPGQGVFCDDCRHVSRLAWRGRVEHVARRFESELVLTDSYRLDGPAELELEADFEPMMVLRGFARIERSEPVARELLPAGVRLARQGADGVVRRTTVVFDPQPDAGELAWSGGGEVRLTFELDPGRPPAPDASGPPLRVSCSDPMLDRALSQALDDVQMLRNSLSGRPYLIAGIPWYACLFGRDSLLAAMQMAPFDPGLLEGTLRILAERIGTRDDPLRSEQPGKVAHELRDGEAAAVDATPLARYYGSVDATPLFLCGLARHAALTGEAGLLAELREPVEAMLAWMGDGLLAHVAPGPGGLRNQGWKDSPDGVPDEHGNPVEHPIALVEAQGYAIRGRRELAAQLALHGDREMARRLREQAANHERELERLWLADEACYAIALGAKGPSRALASNQGHLLWAGAVDAPRAAAVRDRLMSPELFSGWGVRTLAAGETAYDPASYHRGSVWPHDTAMIASGLLAYGFTQDFREILFALASAAEAAPDGRLPELFSGTPRSDDDPPDWLEVSCRPQAWAATALPYLLTRAAGIAEDGSACEPVELGVDFELSGVTVGGNVGDISHCAAFDAG